MLLIALLEWRSNVIKFTSWKVKCEKLKKFKSDKKNIYKKTIIKKIIKCLIITILKVWKYNETNFDFEFWFSTYIKQIRKKLSHKLLFPLPAITFSMLLITINL